MNRAGVALAPARSFFASRRRSSAALENLAVPGFQRELRRYGAAHSSRCLSCGCCTVVCDLSSDAAPFPRRPIRYALLGLREPLLASIEPWLCHDCGDCATTCPSAADPAETMATLRRYLAAQYDVTGLSARIHRSKAWEAGALVFAALLVVALAYGYHLWASGLTTSDLLTTPMGLEHMFPMITWFTWAVFAIPLLVLFAGAVRMHRMTMRGRRVRLATYAIELRTMLTHLVSHLWMRACSIEKKSSRWLGHWLLGFSFAAMSVILLAALPWFQTDRIAPIYDPQRWIGYLITAVMIGVPAEILLGRRKRTERMYRSSRAEDIALPLLILLTALSGLVVHFLRYLELGLACHFAYLIHLAIAVPLVVVELPFGKLAHVAYRPLAIYLQAVRALSLAEPDAEQPEESTAPVAAPEAGVA